MRSTLTIFTELQYYYMHACIMHDEHMDDVSLHAYIHVRTYMCISYSNFLVWVFSVGLALITYTSPSILD